MRKRLKKYPVAFRTLRISTLRLFGLACIINARCYWRWFLMYACVTVSTTLIKVVHLCVCNKKWKGEWITIAKFSKFTMCSFVLPAFRCPFFLFPAFPRLCLLMTMTMMTTVGKRKEQASKIIFSLSLLLFFSARNMCLISKSLAALHCFYKKRPFRSISEFRIWIP